MALEGQATAEGTRGYAARHADAKEHRGFRDAFGLSLSTIGIGTYLGDPSPDKDAGYTAAIGTAVAGGLNVVDTAINYRNQRSERVVGSVLSQLVEQDVVARNEVFVSTKGGFVPFDQDTGDPQGSAYEEFVKPGLVTKENLVGGIHCMDGPFIQDVVKRSRRNLDLETIDLYYVHNPEMQLSEVDRATFGDRLGDAFAVLEEAVADGHVARYGIATWNGLRLPPDDPHHIGLRDVVQVAEAAAVAAGNDWHHFAAVQAPLSLGMVEAAIHRTQRIGDDVVPLTEACRRLGLALFTSGSIMQGKLARGLPPQLKTRVGDVGTDAQVALQATRSAPGVTTALVGMSRVEHVDAALDLLAGHAPDAERVWTVEG